MLFHFFDPFAQLHQFGPRGFSQMFEFAPSQVVAVDLQLAIGHSHNAKAGLFSPAFTWRRFR